MGDCTLILLRHGESQWNALNLFTGWVDVDLTDKGRAEALRAGELIAGMDRQPDVLYTSLLRRAITTANIALDKADRPWIPVHRDWRLNERHYGDLTGKNKQQTSEQFGEDQVLIWRRSYDTPPPPIAADNEFNPNVDARYADLPPELVPQAECLADVVDRMLPYWYDSIVPDLVDGRDVLVVAHGNSLRALVKHLQGISDDAITGLNIPTGVPLLYELGDDLAPIDDTPVEQRYLADADEVAAKAAAVARQASGG